MKILVLGSGGREHAIGLKLLQSPKSPTLLFAPGNPGMAALGQCFPIPADDIPGLLALAEKEAVDLTVVGPETPLVKGIVDAFAAKGCRIFGPTAKAAQLEGSKAFSKEFMARHHIPTAAYQTFRTLEPALKFLEQTGAPVVVKASGLCAGKGAIVCQTLEEARSAVLSMLGPKPIFGEAGSEVVVEEFMDGEEASIFAICDGQNFVLLPSAQDHKRVFDGDQGPNTGGMGAYSPAPVMTATLLDQVNREIITPTLKGMAAMGYPYQGVLFVGLMITASGPKVIEYNCRLGDPETQAVLPVFDGDLVDLLSKATDGALTQTPMLSPSTRTAAVVVLASGGYPGEYETGFAIHGIENAESIPGVHVVHAGTKRSQGQLQTSGGRVLGVVGNANSLKAALQKVYQGVSAISFQNMHYRHDIGSRGLAAG